ncbi:hypothetical protein DL96DRAFT_1668350 [Flagelloscypha sp. PMI_526]|nr:hypothetical protein DL96DRAFT_1668350 [Flagelloscypha sp. PMI_526]
MSPSRLIRLQRQGKAQPVGLTAPEELLRRTTSAPRDGSGDSALLKAIRSALRGADTSQSGPSSSIFYNDRKDLPCDDEITWDQETVIVSTGGVIRKIWTFTDEQEPVQYACYGVIEENWRKQFHLPKPEPFVPSPDKPNERATFGPFTRANMNKNDAIDRKYPNTAVFVFLRRTGKVYLRNGLEYTFNLPFIVRRAWPIYPLGVLLQRVIEPYEVEEAAASGEEPLPSIFSLISPFAEALPVGGLNSHAALIDDTAAENGGHAPSPVSTDFRVVVTVDTSKRTLSVWTYGYIRPKSQQAENVQPTRLRSPPQAPSLASLAMAAPVFDAPTAMANLIPSADSPSQTEFPARPRKNSLTRTEVTSKLDSLALGSSSSGTDSSQNMDIGKMATTYWMERVLTRELAASEAQSWRSIQVSAFDTRWDCKEYRSHLAISVPASQTDEGRRNSVHSALSTVALRVTRANVKDLLVLGLDGHSFSVLTHGLHEVGLKVVHPPNTSAVVQTISDPLLTYADGSKATLSVDLHPEDKVTLQAFQMLARLCLRIAFLEEWCALGRTKARSFEAFEKALERVFQINGPPVVAEHAMDESEDVTEDSFESLLHSPSHQRLCHDRVLTDLKLLYTPAPERTWHPELGSVMFALQLLAEELRLQTDLYFDDVKKLALLVCRCAVHIRPEWVDYWKRRLPTLEFPTGPDHRIPVWPPDFYATLQAILREGPMTGDPNPLGLQSNPNLMFPTLWPQNIDLAYGQHASLEYGLVYPLDVFQGLSTVFRHLADDRLPTVQKKAEFAVVSFFKTFPSPDFLNTLPLGLAAGIREAIRTCSVEPPVPWGKTQLMQYIGRTDIKSWLEEGRSLKTVGGLVKATRAAAWKVDTVSGVEILEDEMSQARFSTDKRLEEVARLLNSSVQAVLRTPERPELSEHDQIREYQALVTRSADRTLALPFGRAMFTFGTVNTLTREAYAIPKFEFSVRIQPQGITLSAEPGKVPPEAIQWGDFHNGVAAALRISPKVQDIENAWIAFNKSSEMSSQHAGFLFGLGLGGHLKNLMTWQTFDYLTVKQDLTSIGVLLGMAIGNVGSGDESIAKLLAIHTPALLPSPEVDLNTSMLIQATGLSGIGLLYLGTKNRRMAEVCLSQICRNDLTQPSLSNEYREAYTNSAALAFGMIMVGKGSDVPADMHLVSRLTSLVHGSALPGQAQRTFDVNLTSPAATIALGLMYLRTGRADLAGILNLPETPVQLNRIQPSFLLFRTISRGLIMWHLVQPSQEWVISQIPVPVRQALNAFTREGKPYDSAVELAYWNIMAGAAFVIGLKFAGSNDASACKTITWLMDMFSRYLYGSPTSTFEHRLRRSALRDGLNLINISFGLVMAVRRSRQAFGHYQALVVHAGYKYNVHLANSVCLGMPFLGGGRYLLGTSDSAIAALVTAFFPRWAQSAHDNRVMLQPLRHLWVLAVEPRILMIRDADNLDLVAVGAQVACRDKPPQILKAPTPIPDLDDVLYIRTDPDRYWPVILRVDDMNALASFLKTQTIFVRRRSSHLDYTTDPAGTRGLASRSGVSAGDAAMLDFPHPRSSDNPASEDLSDFLSSGVHDIHFLAFADHFCRPEGVTESERLFDSFCLSLLWDCLLHDKRTTMQSHLSLFSGRMMTPSNEAFHMRLHDLSFASFFYGTIQPRANAQLHLQDSANASPNQPRQPRPLKDFLLRDSTVHATIHSMDLRLTTAKATSQYLLPALEQYVCGQSASVVNNSKQAAQELAWYLVRHGVPHASVMSALRALVKEGYSSTIRALPQGDDTEAILRTAIKEVLHLAGNKMSSSLGSGWSVQSLEDILPLLEHCFTTNS